MSGQRQTKGNLRSRDSTAAKRIGVCCVCGSMLGIAATAGMLLLSAWIISGCGMPASALTAVGAVCGVLGAGVSGFISGIIAGEKGLPVGAISGLIWGILLLTLHLFLSDGGISSSAAIKAGIGLLLSAICGVWGAGLKRRKEKSRYVY